MTIVAITLLLTVSRLYECCNINVGSLISRQFLVQTITVIPLTTLLPVKISCLSAPTFPPYSYKRNKRQLVPEHNYATFAWQPTDWATRLGNAWTQPNAYRRANEEILGHNSHSQNLPNKLNSLINNKSPRPQGVQTLNGGLNRNKYLLQYLNNPLLYAYATTPLTIFTGLYSNDTTPFNGLHSSTRRTLYPTTITTPFSVTTPTETTFKPVSSPQPQDEEWSANMYNNFSVMSKFIQSLDNFERKFYKVTFEKLSSISAAGRQENGISFAQSGLFLHLALLALSSEVDYETSREIEECTGLNLTHTEKIYVFREMVSTLPKSSDALKFRLSTRLVLDVRQQVTPLFQHGVATALKLNIDRVNNTDSAESLTATLNEMVEKDSGGAMRDTFEEEELSDGICAVLLTTMYLRPRWRSAPTVLNGTQPFLDTADAPTRSTRMIRINDIMRYAELLEWDAEAIEIFYSTPGLSLLIVVPRGRSLRKLSTHVTEASIDYVLEKMYSLRVAVSLPLYTLRMTLLVPGKLQAMGVSRLVDDNCDDFRLSHAVQRLMFWSEAGRNAFKDDGIEWDDVPELELVVNRPYIFFVRWRNLTIMNGNFVL